MTFSMRWVTFISWRCVIIFSKLSFALSGIGWFKRTVATSASWENEQYITYEDAESKFHVEGISKLNPINGKTCIKIEYEKVTETFPCPL